ncbi:MAG TPA: tripartite tricarboxylate transporter TctB family protein [Longimicrobiales bacterium]|nr:tripartite tricarboxylate transporter TctB family protein [Longimicrobiales bacterium]
MAGVALVVAGAAIGLEATTFDVSFITDPVGPKALPYLVAAMLLLAGVHAALRPPTGVTWPDRATLLQLAGATAAFLAYTVALDVLGFVLSTTLVVAALSHLYGARPGRGVTAALLLSIGLWLLFVRVLALPLPVGSLWIR